MHRSSYERLRPKYRKLSAHRLWSLGHAERRWDVSYLFGRHRLLRSLVQLLNGLLVISQILLAADEDDGEALAEMQDFRDPL